MTTNFSLTDQEKNILCELAHWGILCGFAGKQPDGSGIPAPPEGVLRERLGSFVTLKRAGQLRGCIGTILPQEELYKNVASMAFASAFHDHRFPPLVREELDALEIEISVLGPITPCPDPERIEVGRHGLLLSLGARSGVFLPKVPVELGWDRPAYLENLCRKAGLPGGSWKDPKAQLFWYEALVFSAKELAE
ncbi:MAG: AmmeMemoRadiSam system protein A, partial [Deltaproteobacteria bacterium]|nr:AmmeMemoRadiSam system protein A [Deltaproteobacteria bacterium]